MFLTRALGNSCTRWSRGQVCSLSTTLARLSRSHAPSSKLLSLSPWEQVKVNPPASLLPPSMHAFISFILQILSENVLCSRHWKNLKKSKQNSVCYYLNPCLFHFRWRLCARSPFHGELTPWVSGVRRVLSFVAVAAWGHIHLVAGYRVQWQWRQLSSQQKSFDRGLDVVGRGTGGLVWTSSPWIRAPCVHI